MSDLVIGYRGQQIDVLALMHHIMEHDVKARYSPWFFSYYENLTGHDYMVRYLRFLRKLFSLRQGGVTGLRVLDAGCGFGIMSILIALLGAEQVHSIDTHRGMIETFALYLDILPLSLPVYPRRGDVAAMPYEDSSFDLILSSESISHYRDVDAFLRESFRLLSPGGTLIISDSNNGRNGRIVRETWETWRAFEQGPATENIHGHRVEKPFVEQRAAIIRREYPQLTESEIAQLAAHTSGRFGQGLHDAVEGYVRTGVLPTDVYSVGACPIDPVQGYYIERLFDPLRLAEQIISLGFQTRVMAYLGGARGGPLALANELLTRLPQSWVLPWAPSFRIVAHKPPRGAAESAPCV